MTAAPRPPSEPLPPPNHRWFSHAMKGKYHIPKPPPVGQVEFTGRTYCGTYWRGGMTLFMSPLVTGYNDLPWCQICCTVAPLYPTEPFAYWFTFQTADWHRRKKVPHD